MTPSPAPPEPAAPARRWAMLLALIAGFAISQAFRTITAILATGLRGEFGLTPQALGTFAGAFAFAFGAMQLFVGVGIDLYGLRRTMLAAFPLAIAGALLSALAPGYGWVLAGEVRHPPERLRRFPPLSQRCALRAGGRSPRCRAAFARLPWAGTRQFHGSRTMRRAIKN